MQILILGMHRSGTSAVARLINMMGAYFAPEGMALSAKPDNPKGFWERKDVLSINNELLKFHQCEWNNLAHWDFENASKAPPVIKQKMHALIMNMDAFRPWFIKDPRMCLTLPVWLAMLEAPLAVIVYRNPHEIALSLHKRSGIDKEYALALWEYYMVGMLNKTRNMPRILVSYEETLATPVKCCEKLHSKLASHGVKRLVIPSHHEIKAFIDPRLYRAKAADATSFSPAQKALCDILQGLRDQTATLQVSPDSKEIIQKGLPADYEQPR
jgi:hypothetical protein